MGRGPLPSWRAWLDVSSAVCLLGPGESSTAVSTGYNRSVVPELPDLAIVADAFHAALAGRSVTLARAPGPLAVRGTPSELEALVGQKVTRIGRRGKLVLIDLDRGRIVVNPMLTGRFQLAAPGAAMPTKTAMILGFGPRAGRPRDSARWTAGAAWMPVADADVEVRYRDPTQMGKVYLMPAGVARAVPGLTDEEIGPDADDPRLTLDVWRSRIRRHPGELKNVLKNQSFVAGIGNAYSDEILHVAGLLPFRRRSTLATNEVDALYEATRTTLAGAIETLRLRVPPSFENQARDWLAVHGKGGQPCPRCGTRISEVRPGGFVTSFCRACQR